MRTIRKIAVMAAFACMMTMQAKADPYLIYLAAMYGTQIASTVGPPIVALTSYGICHTPAIHIFGNERITVGLDWSSFSARSRNVYGLQMSILGGGFAEDLYGIELGLLSCGWVDNYDISKSRMNGIEIAPFAVKASTVNGFQVCPFYARAKVVNGFQTGGFYSSATTVHGIQCGIVNVARRVEGLQIGLYNATSLGHCLQIGLINCVVRKKVPILPLINFSFR